MELFHVVMMEVAPHAEFGGCGLSGRRAIDGLFPLRLGRSHDSHLQEAGNKHKSNQPKCYDEMRAVVTRETTLSIS